MPEEAPKTDAQTIAELRDQVASLTVQLANANTRIAVLEKPSGFGSGFVGRHKL